MVFVFGSHLTMILPTSKFHLFATAATLGNGHDENGGRHGPYRGRVRQGRSREQSVVRGGAQRAALPPSMVLLVIKSVFCFFPIPFLYLNLFFARYAKHDSASMCIHIAFHLPNKTAKDVALRWRWSQVTDFLLELGACVRSTVSCAYNK